MPRESAQTKGRRYCLEGRLVVTRVTDDEIRARCRGQGHSYNLGWNPADRWWCDCPARTRCSHLVALQLVTLVGSHVGDGS